MDKTELSTGAIDPIYGNRPLVKSSRKTGIESTASAMETNAVSKNTCRYPIDNYLVPAVIGNSNYLQLSDFRESSSSVEPTATPHSETPRLYEPKNGKSNSINQSNFLDQPKSSNTGKDLNTNQDEPKLTPRKSKMEEIDRAMQTIRKQIMQSELDIMKLQAESMMKIDDESRGKNISGGIKNVQEASIPINNKKMIAHHRITHDGLVHEYHSLLNTSEKTCLCCYKPKNFPLDHKNSRNFSQNQETSNVSIDKEKTIKQLKKDSTDTHSSHKRFPMENCQQFHGDLSYCEKTTQNIRRSNSGNSNRRELGENLGEVQEDNREQRNVEKSVHSQVSKNDCCWKDRLMRHDNSFESHGSGARNMPKLDLATLEGFDRSPEEFIENELPQLITDTRSQSRYASSVRLDNSCEGEDISLRMGSTSKKQNVGTFKPNAALHRVVSQESSTNLKNHSEIHQSNNNSKLSRLKKALLPGVNIRSELSVQSGPTIHIPAASKFLVSSEKNKNVLLKEIVHVETEREIIICPPRNDLVENVVKNNVVVKHKVEKPEKDSKPVELSHPQTPKSTNRKVVEKQLTEGLSNNEIQEHLYNAVRTYANKLNSQNNTKIQKQLKETLQELSFNISRLYNNQMNEYVQCGRNRDIQAPLSYRMKAVAELLWEELELRTYPSEEHYSQIEQIIHHLVNDLEDAIIPLKSTIKGDIPFKTSQPTTQGHEKNLPIKNNHLDCFKESTQFKAGGKNAVKKNSTTKFSYKSTSSLGRSYVTERNKKCDRRLLKGTTSQLKPDSSSNSKKITETAKNGLRKDENKFTVVKRSTYSNEFDEKCGRTSSNKNCRETESIQRSSKEVRLEGTSAKDPRSMSKDLSGTKQVFSEKSQFISDSPSRKNSDLRNDSTGQNDQTAQIFRPRSASDDEDLMRFKRINTLYKLNKKLHSPIKTTAEIFSDESVTHDQCDAETTKKMTEHSSFDTARKNTAEGDVALPKNTENSSPLETNGPEVNQTPISNSEESIDQQIDGEVDDSNIVNELQLTNDEAQNTVKEITPQSMEQENSEGNEMNDIKIRLETVEEETEPSASHKSDDTDRDKSSNESEKSEKEKDDESYEDDWEIDQDEVSLNQDENSPAHKHQEPKDVESHHSIEESLSSSSTTSLSVVSEIKNDKSSKSGDSIQEGTYVKEKSPSKVAEIGKNHNEHLRLNESTLDGLKLSLHSDEDINKEVTKDVIIEDKQDSIHEEVIESGGSKTFDVIKDVDVDGNNTVTISSSVSSEILQNDGKFDLNSEDFTTVKNMNANLLIPLSARSNTTAEIRSDSVGMNAENCRIIREMESDEIINNKGQCDKMCTNDAKIIPSTSFHLSIPEAMDHQQNTITMISNLKNQEFKVTLELNKNHVGTLNCVKSSSDDYRVKSRSATEGGMEFEQKPCKSVNTEPIVENFETFHGRSRRSGLNGNNLSGSQVQEVAGIVKLGGVGIVDQGVARIVDQGVSRIVDQGNAGIVTGNQGVFEIVNQEVAKIVDQGSVKGVTQEMHQKLVQQIDWEAKFHDLSQLRNRVEGLESTLTSTVGAFLERLNSGLADKTPCTSGREVGISCKLNELRSSHCQTDDFLVLKPAENIEQTQLINNEENIPAQKTSLTEEINKILNFNRGGAEKNLKKPVDSSTANENFLQRKYGTQSSSSKSSSLLSIAPLSASEEKSQSELSEGEMGMEAAICSCSFGEIKMSGCSRCGPYGVKKLSIKRSYPNLQKSDGEMSVKNVQHSSSDYSASHSVDYYTKLRLDVKRDSKTMFKFKSKSLSQNKVAASKSFTNVVEGIMNELKKEKMEARMKFKRSQDNFDAQFFKHSESLMRSASEISLRMKSSVVDHATASSTQKYSEKTTHQNFHRTDSEELLRNSQPLTRKSQINNISSMEVVSDESGDSEVAVKELQELDSNSLFRLIRKRKNRQLHENRYQDLKGSEESSTKTDVRGELKLDFDLFTAGKSKSGPVIDEPNLEEIGTSTRVQSIEEVLKTFFSSTGSSEHEPAGKTRQNKFYEGESSLIRTRKDLLDNDSCDSTILSNTSEDRDRSEGQI